MADPRNIASVVDVPADSLSGFETRVLLTQADFDALVRELEALRSRHRTELARRLREARAFGGSSENDDLLAVAEDAAFEQARIAQLEELVRLAAVVDGPSADDGAGLGSIVRVSDDTGRERQYALIGRRSEQSRRHEVTMASPVGRALWGARRGDVVDVALPNGRSRTFRVLDVVHDSIATGMARRKRHEEPVPCTSEAAKRPPTCIRVPGGPTAVCSGRAKRRGGVVQRRAPSGQHPREARDARPCRADALRDPPRARSALTGPD